MRVSRHLHFEDTKIIMAPELRSKSFGTFENRAPDPVYVFFRWLYIRFYKGFNITSA